MENRTAPTKLTRVPELDGIRGCAILLVLIWHYIPCQIQSGKPVSVFAVVRKCLILTWSGVDLFFILSGFLIAGILLDNRAATNYFGVFYVRRIFRIFPLYFLLLGIALTLVTLGFNHSPRFNWALENPLPFWTYATFTQNVFMGLRNDYGPHMLAITWSLAVEEQFYLFIPLLVWVLPRRVFVVVALILVILAPLLRAGAVSVAAGVWTPLRSDSLLTGALLAVAVRERKILDFLRANIKILYAVFLGFLAGAMLLIIMPKVFGSADHTWLAGLYGLFLLLAVVDRETVIAKMLRHRALIWLGVMSYGLYMFHEAASGMLHGFLGNGTPSVESFRGAALTFLALLLTIVLTVASYHLFERPLIDFGHRFKYQKATNKAT